MNRTDGRKGAPPRRREIAAAGAWCAAVLLFVLFPPAVPAQLVDRAPDVFPGTLPEMRTPVYWIGRMEKPDEVLISPDGIRRMNRAFRMLLGQPGFPRGLPGDFSSSLISWWPGVFIVPLDMEKTAPRALADSVRSWIAAEIRYLRRGRFGNVAGVRYSGRDIDRFERETAFDRIPGEIRARTGVAVRRTRLRVIPSRFPLEQGICDSSLSVSGKIIPIAVHWDLFNNGFLPAGEPVRVLHTSCSGEFLFLAGGGRFGWAASEDIAFASVREIAGFSDPPRFVVCTGDRVPFFADPLCREASGWFGMGDRLPFEDAFSPRKIRIPVRRADGSLGTADAWLAEGADVHVGWMPYTRRNIVLTAFKLLDTPYDWTGAWFGRDHITTWRDLFAVFGFDLPRHDGLFFLFGRNREIIDPSVGRDRQHRAILEHEPFVTVMSCGGHAKLLLGGFEGRPIVFDHYGHGYVDSTGKYVELCRSFVGDMSIPAYFLNHPVTFLELRE